MFSKIVGGQYKQCFTEFCVKLFLGHNALFLENFQKRKLILQKKNVFRSFNGWYLNLLLNKQHLRTFNIVLFLLVWTNTFTKVFTRNDSLSCEHVLLYANIAIHHVWCFFSKESETSLFQIVFTQAYTPKRSERLWRFAKAK